MSGLTQVQVLHVPEGIKFLCSGCANCCHSWPVPITDEDIATIKRYAGPSANQRMFRPLAATDERMRIYTHSLEKRADGRCEFLNEDNRCSLHAQFGPEAKPSMCRLFPYTFTPAPSGTYASVSFASSAVLYNEGTPLTEQRDVLESQWQLFQKLMPNYQPDWSGTQLMDGVPLGWERYLELESGLLELFHPGKAARQNLVRSATAGSEVLCRAVPTTVDLDRNLTELPVKIVDQLLLSAFSSFYFPLDVFKDPSTDIPARAIAEQLVVPPNKVRLVFGGREVSAGDLIKERLNLSNETEDLLRRFVYCRIFSKLYFGAGYNGLSVVSGYHHLIALVALVCMHLKAAAHKDQSQQFSAAIELIRALERRLTIASFSRGTVALLEVLCASPARLQRILSLSL